MERELSEWDGKSIAQISWIYKLYQHDSAFIDNLVKIIKEPYFQKGATWLLKHHLENQNPVTLQDANLIYSQLDELENWEAQLHILQSLPYMPISQNHKGEIEKFLRECLGNEKKFVRAWAYNGFHILAEEFSEYKEEVTKLFEQALREEAASVKARIRQLMNKKF